MSRPSEQIAARYRLHLSDEWKSWFDSDMHGLRPAGAFQTALSADSLTLERPAEIWAGFMLPDTLPILGNEYGDWICVRVLPDGRLGELLHWYHGGGDWIPLGFRLAEAMLHDVVDQFRPVSRQVLRGAAETVAHDHRSHGIAAFAEPDFRTWLTHRLTTQSLCGDHVAQSLDALEHILRSGNYADALRVLRVHDWSRDAVACDLIEEALQRPIAALANPAIAKSLEINWTPDYIRWLFDAETVPIKIREQIGRLAGLQAGQWPEQDWGEANALASEVLSRRDDVGWAFDIAGWAKHRDGDTAGAAAVYFDGRYASAYSNQAVRLRTHWVDDRFGKFAIAQLASLSPQLPTTRQVDSYLSTIWRAPDKLMLTLVQEYWCARGGKCVEALAYAAAYESYYRAGWDLGVQCFSEYQRILELLIQSAMAAGWHARAAIAETHLACLLGRYA